MYTRPDRVGWLLALVQAELEAAGFNPLCITDGLTWQEAYYAV